MKYQKIFLAGHKGMVGSALFNLLKKKKNVKLIIKDRSELNLVNQKKVKDFFRKEKIDQIYLAAAKVGGIYANNKFPAEFIYENIMIQANIIHSAFQSGVKKLLFLGSSCIYPKNVSQPMKENALLTGNLEATNEPYAIAKIAGIKLCESYNRQYSSSHNIDYRCVMPTNLYGPGDNYHPLNSHVIAGLIKRFHDAKKKDLSKVIVWGTGNAMREFLFVEDMAEACHFIMSLDKKIIKKNTSPMCSHINIGSGIEISIKNLAEKIKKITNYKGRIEYKTSKPDGSPRKLIDSNKINNFGWFARTDLETGLIKTYKNFLKSNANT